MTSDERSAQADALLDQIRKDQRGRLKVFLGAAPGVGKTYAMLGAARDLRRQGVDVVVGLAETHGRAETEALLEGLEVLPRQRLDYKGRTLEDLDLDALLARRPQVALVDELAHTNAPGCRHERRYQDIEELLDAGIDVFTTVNIQHLESLNDVVAQITGVRVRETVPDSLFDRLRDIVLVDLPPRELIERLRQGKVYVPAQAQAALQAYFSPSNLTALRELAMQTAADRVDADLRGYLSARGLAGTTPIRRHLLVAVDGHAHTEYLVRAGRRVAERSQMPWTVAYVDTGRRRSRTDREALHAALQLAQRLGAETMTLRGTNVADELLACARRQGATSILLGRTRERRLARILNRTITQQLLDRGERFELTILNTPYARLPRGAGLEPGETTSELVRQHLFATVATAIATALCAALQSFLPVASMALIFLCAVLVVAVRSRLRVAVFAAVLSALAYNFFFTEPRFTLRIQSSHDIVAVAAFFVTALLSGRLASRLRSQVVMLRAATEHSQALQRLGEKLTSAADENQVLRAGCEALAAALGAEVVVLRRGGAGQPPAVVAARPEGLVLDGRDLAAADWVVAHEEPAGRFTATLAASAWWLVPMAVERRCLGAVGLRLPPSHTLLTLDERQLAEAMIQQVTFAADRTELVADLESARVEGETERLRTALLSSVSHDLRSPLASVIGAATSLSAYGESMPAGDRGELLESIRAEAGRLDRYVQNLLDMTRLGAGGLKLQRDWVALDDIVGSALARARKLFPETELVAELEPGLPLLWVHPALIEQALFNVLENAAKFSPPAAPVRLAAWREGDRLLIDVCDRGPGIPAEERRRIFDMFYSAGRGDRGARGSGLGLTIVRGMIGAHGGRVEALEGPDGVGTRIRLTLPITEVPAAAPAEEEE